MAYKIIPDDLMTQVDGAPAIRAAHNPDSAVLEALFTTVRKPPTSRAYHRLLSEINHLTQMPFSVTRRKILIFIIMQAQMRLFGWET